jgi:hypothetical protein
MYPYAITKGQRTYYRLEICALRSSAEYHIMHFTFSQGYIENVQFVREFYLQKPLLILLKVKHTFVVVLSLPPLSSKLTFSIPFCDARVANCPSQTPCRVASWQVLSMEGSVGTGGEKRLLVASFHQQPRPSRLQPPPSFIPGPRKAISTSQPPSLPSLEAEPSSRHLHI